MVSLCSLDCLKVSILLPPSPQHFAYRISKYRVTVSASVVSISCLEEADSNDPTLFLIEGLGVADCVQGTQSVVAVPVDTPASQVNSDTAPAIRSPETLVCRGSNPPAKTFVLRSVLKKPGKLFAENIKVKVALPKAKEY